MDLGQFDITIDGVSYKANTIMNFSLYDSYYCIYGILNDSNNYDVYCGKILGNTVVPIDDEGDKRLTNKIVLALVNAIKESV